MKKVLKDNPEIYKPLEDFFGINAEERLNNKKHLHGLYYEEY